MTTANLERKLKVLLALDEYMRNRGHLAQLEAMVDEDCRCDPENFHRCELCDEIQEGSSRGRVLMNLWGDSWAVMLAEKVK